MTDQQPRQRPHREKVAIGFMILWVVFWTACMFIVLYGLVVALWERNMTPAAFMLVWLAVATFGLSKGIRTLRTLMLDGLGPPAPARNHDWKDEIGGKAPQGSERSDP